MDILFDEFIKYKCEQKLGLAEGQATGRNLELVEKKAEQETLRNNVARTKRLYDEMVDRLSRINVSIDTAQSNIAIHEPAILFSKPVSPNRRKVLAIAAVVGVVGGALVGTLFGVGLLFAIRRKPAGASDAEMAGSGGLQAADRAI